MNRLVCVLFVFTSWLLTQSSSAQDSLRPNVVIIFTDDQGWADAGCYGSTDILTPGIDSLANHGVRFTQFYAAAPVCSPSRAGLMTGRNPVRAGLPSNAPSQEGKPGMPTTEVTIAEAFRTAGYRTGHVGKWHLGYTQETMPLGQGYDFSFGHMGGCIDNYSHFFYWQGPNRHDLWLDGKEIHRPGRFFPDMMVEQAKEFIGSTDDQPFFLYFAANVPHYPYQGDPDWLDRYKHLPYPRNLYAAFLSTLDARIKHFLAYLDETGLRENTIVVFQSDHGYSTEERAHHGGGSAGPFRGSKFSLYEGGIRVPAIISWPGHIPESQVRDQISYGCDWFPTLLELSGVSLPDVTLDGKSLVPVLKSTQAPSAHEHLHWGTDRYWAVRRGDWKLIFSKGKRNDSPEGPWLSNIRNDPGEQTNFASDQPTVVDELTKLHQKMFDSFPAR